MQRTIFFTLLFATLAGLGIAGSSWVAYQRVRSALDRDFERAAERRHDRGVADHPRSGRRGARRRRGELPAGPGAARHAADGDRHRQRVAHRLDAHHARRRARARGRGGPAERARYGRARGPGGGARGDAARHHVVRARGPGAARRPGAHLWSRWWGRRRWRRRHSRRGRHRGRGRARLPGHAVRAVAHAVADRRVEPARPGGAGVADGTHDRVGGAARAATVAVRESRRDGPSHGHARARDQEPARDHPRLGRAAALARSRGRAHGGLRDRGDGSPVADGRALSPVRARPRLAERARRRDPGTRRHARSARGSSRRVAYASSARARRRIRLRSRSIPSRSSRCS